MTTSVLIALLHASLMGSDAGSYPEAYRQTMETGRPLVVLVGAEWCPPCQRMKQHVLPEVRKRGCMDKVCFAVVDCNHSGELAQELIGGGPIPRLVMYCRTPKGWRRSELMGSQSAGTVEQFIRRGIASAVAPALAVRLAAHRQVNRR